MESPGLCAKAQLSMEHEDPLFLSIRQLSKLLNEQIENCTNPELLLANSSFKDTFSRLFSSIFAFQKDFCQTFESLKSPKESC